MLDSFSWPLFSLIVLLLAVLITALVLWRRYLSRAMLMQRVSELEALSAAGRAIVAAELDVAALCELIAQEAGRVVESDTFQVGLFDRSFYRIYYWRVNGRIQETPCTFDLSEDRGLVGWVRDGQKPLIIADFSKQMAALPVRPRYVSESPPRSALFIPLVHGEESIGIVVAQSKRANAFNEEDKRRLMILANQAAAAIANAQLYDQARSRATYLELVGQIARQVNAVSDLDEIFDQVVQLTRETFGFHPVNIFGVEGQAGEVVMQASSIDGLAQYQARLSPWQGLVGTTVATKETIVCNNTAEDERFLHQLEALPSDVIDEILAEITIPLVVNDELLGVLDVQSAQVGVFTDTEKTVLEALAAEVASAIYKAQQLAQQQAQSWMTTAQLQVAEGLSNSRDLEEMVTAVARLTPMLAGVSFCGIMLWDEESQRYQGAALYGLEHQFTEEFVLEQFDIGDWHALDAVHVGQEALITSHMPAWLRHGLAADSQVQILPLLVAGQEQMQGVMLVEALPEFAHDADMSALFHHDLLQNISEQTARAIESARLRVAQQEEAWVNTALLQVAEAVNSLIDLNEILYTIVRLVPLLVGVESALILIWDDERKLFLPGPSHGISEMGIGLLNTLQINEAEFRNMRAATAVTATSPRPYYAINVPQWLRTVLGTIFAYAFPLNAQGRLVGAMVVGRQEIDRYSLSPRRLNILNGIAQQAATAVVNNQLYKESAERERLQQELDVARTIQASFLPEGSPDIPGCNVATFWQAARQVSGDFYDFLPRPDGTWGIVIADVADKGVPAALFMALSRTILRTVGFNRRDPANVLMRANAIIEQDAQTDLFVTVFYAVWDPQKGILSFANGGHNPPLLLSRDGQARLLKVPGIALGVLPEIELTTHKVRLEPGDTLLLYTDGVTEAMNEDYDEFGMERLNLAIRSVPQGDAAKIVTAVVDGIADHVGGMPQFDDITMVVLSRSAS